MAVTKQSDSLSPPSASQKDKKSPCGRIVQKSLRLQTDCTRNRDYFVDECNRTYLLYLPDVLCDNENSGNNNNDDEPVVVPLMFSIHCFGCNAATMQSWKKEASSYGFALVIPEGLMKGFNAKVCCGAPVKRQVDDKEFFREIIRLEVEQRYGAKGENRVSSEAVYATGWSNGAYMAVFAASMFRAIAPISGYQYDDRLDTLLFPDSEQKKPVGLFLHHAVDDSLVQITGCCRNTSMPRCCCGISQASPIECLSASGFALRFAVQINGCSDNTPIWKDSWVNRSQGISCHTAIPEGSSLCQQNVTYCIHQSGAHFNRPNPETAFTMRSDIMEFFSRDACLLHGKLWNPSTMTCYCESPYSRSDRFCLSSSLSSTSEDTSAGHLPDGTKVAGSPNVSDDGISSNSWGAFVLALILLGMVIFGYRQHRATYNRYKGFAVAPTVELTVPSKR